MSSPPSPSEAIHVYLPGDPGDPRNLSDLPEGVVVHRGPPLHPDDLTVLDGIPVTSPSRTLIDCAEVMSREELRECFVRALESGLLAFTEFDAARARVEWRPSLDLLDAVADEFR